LTDKKLESTADYSAKGHQAYQAAEDGKWQMMLYNYLLLKMFD